mmetsp:Transcript_16818/g.13785  ORF Transcript_16818/g.13785 Transcript_16818/m.13785 type:complete len:97 (+) Transcript_16818:175-465(+)
MLVNCIYFKGNFLKAFDKNYTTNRVFNASKTKEIKVLTMYDKRGVRYIQNKRQTIIELEYKEEKCALLILMPNSFEEKDALQENDFFSIFDVCSTN